MTVWAWVVGGGLVGFLAGWFDRRHFTFQHKREISRVLGFANGPYRPFWCWPTITPQRLR